MNEPRAAISIRPMLDWLEGPGNQITLVYSTMEDAMKHREWLFEELKARGRNVNKDEKALRWQVGSSKKVARFLSARALNTFRGIISHRLYFEQWLRGSEAYSLALFGFQPTGDRVEAMRFGRGRLKDTGLETSD